MRDIAGVLLAAGAGTRFGGPKLLMPLPDGTPLGVAAARVLKAALPEAVAVVRPGDAVLARLLAAEGLRVVENLQAALGMGASLAAGVAALPAARGWLIALADMPYIKTVTHLRVAQALAAGAPLAAPFHRGVRGHPVGFGVGFREALLALRGDCGARDLLETQAARLVRIDTDDPGILADVDTAADLAAGS
jgi:molybdenum cofactor cytidylyltransferase